MGALLPGKTDAAGHKADRYANKWGRYLRAPDLWFDLVERAGDRLVPLARVARIRFGVKSGNDGFFLPKDASDEALKAHPGAKDFRTAYGADRDDVTAGAVRILACGKELSERHPMEARFVAPEVHNLKDVRRLTVAPDDCARKIVLLETPVPEQTHAARYVAWGEEQGVNAGSTCAARVTEDRAWYDLTGHRQGALFWSMSQQYRHAVPHNGHDLVCNHNLFDVHPAKGVDVEVLAGVLNASWAVLSKFQYGRPVGNEGNLKTEVVDVNLMLVPDPRRGSEKARARVAAAFKAMRDRPQLRFISDRAFQDAAYRAKGQEARLSHLSDTCELDQPDRHALDDAVLELLGIADPAERVRMRTALYDHLRAFFVTTRRKEVLALENKKKSGRKARVTPQSLALDVVAALRTAHPALLRTYDDLLDATQPFDTHEVPLKGEARVGTADAFAPHAVSFWQGKKRVGSVSTRHEAQQALVLHLSALGVRGYVRVPLSVDTCRALAKRYGELTRQRRETVEALLAERTQDTKLQRDALVKVWGMLGV